MIEALLHRIEDFQGIIFERAVEPALYQLGLIEWADDAFDGVQLALYGALGVALCYAVCRPLELWRPVEPRRERRAVRTDIVYTLVQRLGVEPLILFLLLAPIGVLIEGFLRFHGYIPPTVEELVPPLAAWPFATFLVYVVLTDFAEYWRHRFQHRFSWWWALHSLHHDQRQMTLWSDDRNHVLDDALAVAWRGAIALLIGVEPAQLPFIVLVFRLIESLSHANVRLGFGRWGSALLVGPQFHRVHHAIEHAGPPFDRTQGCNFAVILPVWDVIFRTWRRDADFPPTGVAALAGPEIRCGYLRHQIEGLGRLGAVLAGLVSRRHRGFVAALPEG